MKTLQELGQTIIKMQEAMKQLKIDATPDNCGIMLYCSKKCDEMVEAINEAMKTAPPGDIEIHMQKAAEDDPPKKEVK